MAIGMQTKTIEGQEYTVKQYGARQGGRFKIRLAKLLGPALGSFFAAAVEDKKKISLGDIDLQPHMIEMAIDKLVGNISESDWEDLIIPMFVDYVWKGTKLIGSPAIFDQEFAGEYLSIYKVLYFIVEVNYGSFFKKGSIGSA